MGGSYKKNILIKRKKIRFVSWATEAWKYKGITRVGEKNHELCLILAESEYIMGKSSQ